MFLYELNINTAITSNVDKREKSTANFWGKSAQERFVGRTLV